MSTALFFPPVRYVPKLLLKTTLSIKDLCLQAGIDCRASGAWTGRKIELVRGKEVNVFSEPGDWGNVRMEIPKGDWPERGRVALSVLAYGMHDLVAKQSVIGHKWLRLRPPRGRPKKSRALSVRERQRRFRDKKQN